MKAKTVIRYVKMAEWDLDFQLGHEVKLTYYNIDDYEREILKIPGFGKGAFQRIKKYLTMKNNYWVNLGTFWEGLDSINDFDNHFNKKLIERDKKACYFENKNLTKVA